MKRTLKYPNEMTGFSDEELIQLLKQGELSPLGVLFARYDGMVKSALKRFVPGLTPEEVEDLSQEVFIRVLDLVDSYQEQTRFKAWLYSIAVGKAKNWRRKHWIRGKLMRRHLQDQQEMNIQGLALLEKLETRQSALRALSLLSKPQQEVLWLFAVEGFSGDEISTILSISSNTVWTRLYRARQAVLGGLDIQRRNNGQEEVGS